MNDRVKSFINENMALINEEAWEEIYRKGIPDGFTETLLDCGINPLEQGLDYIPKNFLYESKIQKFEIPNNVTSIGNYAFTSCKSLTMVTFGENSQLTSIGEDAFMGCYSLQEIVIPEGVTSIGKWAFYNCKSLKKIVIPNSVTQIGSCAFSHCESLTEIVIPASVTSIDEKVFYECDSLTIYCEAARRPSSWAWGWDIKDWEHNSHSVVWGYTGK